MKIRVVGAELFHTDEETRRSLQWPFAILRQRLCMNPWVEQTVLTLYNEVALEKYHKILVLSDLRVPIHEPYLRYNFVEVLITSLMYMSLWLRTSALEERKNTSHIHV